MYKPAMPFNVAMKILIPTYTESYGVPQKAFSEPEESELIFGSFRTFGGSETIRNEVYTIVDTATIDTWFNPNLKSDCRIYLCDSGEEYDIISTPEDISMMHQYMQFKVKKVGAQDGKDENSI